MVLPNEYPELIRIHEPCRLFSKMGQKLTYKMMTDADKQAYAVRANALRVAAKSKGQEQATQHFDKALHLKSLLNPVEGLYHGVRALYHLSQQLADLVTGEDVKRAGRAQSSWRTFFRKMVAKYKCDDVDWETFPNVPRKYGWLVKFPFDD